jgi:uncharacterized membrane protein YbaN (DUF454 family)
MAKADYSDHLSKHPSRAMRVLFVLLGSACVAIAIAGLFLPLLPATPFVLLAAACYGRASRRFYNALLNTPAFGPAILEWRAHRSIPYRVKLVAIATMVIAFGASIAFFVEPAGLQAALAGCALLLALWLYRIPSRDAPGRKGVAGEDASGRTR